MIKIREGREKDFPTILQLVKDLSKFEKVPASTVTNSVAQMRKEKNIFRTFVAEQDGAIIGIALYFFMYSTWVGRGLYLEDIYVKPKFRGKKVGSMLLKKIFEVAKKEKCNRVRWQVLDWNKNAIAFYKKRGAKISSEWFNCDFDRQGIENFLKQNK